MEHVDLGSVFRKCRMSWDASNASSSHVFGRRSNLLDRLVSMLLVTDLPASRAASWWLHNREDGVCVGERLKTNWKLSDVEKQSQYESFTRSR